jgi:DNA-binding CsgD family transcriptional regulator
MLNGTFESVMNAQNREELKAEIIRFANHIGFGTVAAAAVYDHDNAKAEFVMVDNTPADYRVIFENEGRGTRDPVMQHCKHSSRPLVWDQSTYVRAGAGESWEEQAVYGYRSGISLALHLTEGRHFMFGVDLDGTLPKNPTTLCRLVADLQLFTVFAQEAASRILLPAQPDTRIPKLAPDEILALRFTIDGRNAWEIGKILNIAERAVLIDLQNAMQKLGCPTKQQAALRAIRLGLLP